MEQEKIRNKILYVDDDEKSRILLRKILETEGFIVSEASGGMEAIEKASRDRPDLLIMDIQMPEMNGLDALGRIREVPELREVPAIALTAMGMEEDKERIVKAGYLGYLSKPIQRLLLIEEVERLLFPRGVYTEEVPEGSVLPVDDVLKGKRVLLVDDNPVHLQMGEKILRNAGMEVLKSVDGKDALKVLESEEQVHVILSDILMPRMDGYQLCRMVKTSGAFLSIPFVFYTSTYADNKDIRFGLDLGAERYIIRPISSRRLLEIVKEVLLEKEKGGGQETKGSREAFMVDDVKYYQEYNERLVSKLEQKLLEIDNAYRTLEMRNEELRHFAEKLKERVKERTLELEEANKNLLELDKKKTEFLNIVAHDLRTPMTTIRSYTELLLKYKDEPEETRDEFLRIIINECVRLGNLVNDYLDLSKLESGLYRFKEEAVNLKEHIENVVSLFRARAEVKGITVESELEHGCGPIWGDPDKLDQVLMNLLSNAVKFCDPGGHIEIRSCSVARGEQPALPCRKSPPVECDSVAVMVRDSGPGIPESSYETIFEKFAQLDTPSSAAGGTGLGLSIVQWIVTHHQGKVWVESRKGEGSAFFLLLPVGKG